MSGQGRVDHDRGLCGKPDIPEGTPLEVVEMNPAHCLCCGAEMHIVPPQSLELRQSGTYTLVCPDCPEQGDPDAEIGGQG
jgi:hypothetical protein